MATVLTIAQADLTPGVFGPFATVAKVPPTALVGWTVNLTFSNWPLTAGPVLRVTIQESPDGSAGSYVTSAEAEIGQDYKDKVTGLPRADWAVTRRVPFFLAGFLQVTLTCLQPCTVSGIVTSS